MEKQFILITGISGSGKTEYGRYLQRMHQFHFIETDNCSPFIEIATTPENPLNQGLVSRCVRMFGLVAVEWGFFVRFLSCVIALKEQGAKLFWFTAPDDVAFAAYLAKRGDNPRSRSLWQVQREEQRSACLPNSEFLTIETTHPDGSFKSHQELDNQVFSQ